MKRLEHLTTFLTVVKETSFAAAGRILGISTAAVCKQINALEKELGVQLLIRSTRRLNLTEAGHLYYIEAEKISAQINEMDALFSKVRGEPSGLLKIGTSRHFAAHHLFPHLPSFLEKYPKITLKIENIERIPDLTKEEIDINMGHRFVGGPNDIIKKIGSTKYVMCASPGYLKKFGIPKNPKELGKHRFITHTMRDPNNVLTFDQGLEIVLKPYLYFNDSMLMTESALQGMGIIKTHRPVVLSYLNAGELVEILQGFDTSEQPLYLAYQPFKHMQAKVRHFIDYFVPKIRAEYF
ncbi:MAG: LysR family transcriptional regulator [Parachlamydiales bacterium]|jgi:DNA-binding transcriptional LysR family regulator